MLTHEERTKTYRGANVSNTDRRDNIYIIDRGGNTSIIDRGDNNSITDRGANGILYLFRKSSKQNSFKTPINVKQQSINNQLYLVLHEIIILQEVISLRILECTVKLY
jgi:hypothetical protein